MATVSILNKDVVIDGVLYPRGALWPTGIVDAQKDAVFRRTRLIIEADASVVGTAPAPRVPVSEVPPQLLANARERLDAAQRELAAAKADMAMLGVQDNDPALLAAVQAAVDRDTALREALAAEVAQVNNAAVPVRAGKPRAKAKPVEAPTEISTQEPAQAAAEEPNEADGIPD